MKACACPENQRLVFYELCKLIVSRYRLHQYIRCLSCIVRRIALSIDIDEDSIDAISVFVIASVEEID